MSASVDMFVKLLRLDFYRRINTHLIYIDRKAAQKETSILQQELSKATNPAFSKTRSAETMEKG